MLFFDLGFDVGVVHDGVEFLVVLLHGHESAEGLFVVVDVGLYRVHLKRIISSYSSKSFLASGVCLGRSFSLRSLLYVSCSICTCS